MSERNDILHGSILKALIKMALPLVVINIINTFYGLADTYFVGMIDEMKVGAVAIVAPIVACGNAFANGLTASALALISQSIGSNNKEKANHIATIIIELCLVVGLCVGLGCIIFAPQLLGWMNTPQEIYADTHRYLIGIAFDCLFLFIIQMYQAIRQANGDSLSGVKISTVASVLNIVFDPLFIFVFKLDILGAALATMFSKACVVPFIFYSLLTEKEKTSINFIKYKPVGSLTKKIILTALPASIGYFISEFGFMIMNKQIVSYGASAISGYGIGNKIAEIFSIPLNGIGTALTPLIGQNLGARNFERTKKSYWVANGVAAVLSIGGTIIGFITGKTVVHLLVKNVSDEVVFEALRYLYFSLATTFSIGWFNNLSAVFIGSGNTKSSLFINVFRLWGVRIPLIFIFRRFTALGVSGIWLAMVLSNFAVSVIGQLWYSFYYIKNQLDYLKY